MTDNPCGDWRCPNCAGYNGEYSGMDECPPDPMRRFSPLYERGMRERSAEEFEEELINQAVAELSQPDPYHIVKTATKIVEDEQLEFEWEGGYTLQLKGAPAQTADLLQWQDSSGTVLGRIKADGTLECSGVIEPLETMSEVSTFEKWAWIIGMLVATTFVIWLLVGGMA